MKSNPVLDRYSVKMYKIDFICIIYIYIIIESNVAFSNSTDSMDGRYQNRTKSSTG